MEGYVATENSPLARMSKTRLEGKSVTEPISTGSLDATQTLSIYPNPSSQGSTMLSFTMVGIDNVTVEIMDLAGKVLFKPIDNKEYPAGSQQCELNLNKLSNGLYYVRLTSSTGSMMQKLSVLWQIK